MRAFGGGAGAVRVPPARPRRPRPGVDSVVVALERAVVRYPQCMDGRLPSNTRRGSTPDVGTARFDTIDGDGSRRREDGTPGESGQAGKARRIFRDPRETPPRAGASVENLRDSLKPGRSGDETRVKIVPVSGHLPSGGR
jgi:hypothetical protein